LQPSSDRGNKFGVGEREACSPMLEGGGEGEKGKKKKDWEGQRESRGVSGEGWRKGGRKGNHSVTEVVG